MSGQCLIAGHYKLSYVGLVLSAYLGTEDAALQTALGLVYPLYLTGGTCLTMSI